MKIWSLIIDKVPLRGALNMAVDEFLFNSVREMKRTFLRFYQWENPTVSLSCGQEAGRVVDLAFCRTHGIDVVRRMTGGKVVLHLRELTYSLASSDTEMFTSTLQESYKLISLALIEGLSFMGVSAHLASASSPAYVRATLPCFTLPARGEVEIGGRKIIGSAQKRSGATFIQHGSVPLDKDETLLKAVARFDTKDIGVSMTSLSEAVGRPIAFDWATSRFALGFSKFFGVEMKPLTFDEKAWQEISDIETERYGNAAWTRKR